MSEPEVVPELTEEQRAERRRDRRRYLAGAALNADCLTSQEEWLVVSDIMLTMIMAGDSTEMGMSAPDYSLEVLTAAHVIRRFALEKAIDLEMAKE